jgi:hypothetical protein
MAHGPGEVETALEGAGVMKGNDRERQRQAVEDRLIRNIDMRPHLRGWPISIHEFLWMTQPLVAALMEKIIVDGTGIAKS